MDRSIKLRFFLFLRRWPGVIAASLLSSLVLVAWWNSSRYSERHLIYLGTRTVEVFSASSLLRVSFVNGHIANFGAKTFYRHPNPRGRMVLRPAVPEFRHEPGLWEVTMGYWHVVGVLFSITVGLGLWEWGRRAATVSSEVET